MRVGTNVGVEISGKGKRFSRPVLVLKKLSKFGFYGKMGELPKSDFDKVKVGFLNLYQ